MFELLGVWVIEWFLWESISEGSTGIQKQFELLEVRVIGGSSYLEYTVSIANVLKRTWKRRKIMIYTRINMFSVGSGLRKGWKF